MKSTFKRIGIIIFVLTLLIVVSTIFANTGTAQTVSPSPSATASALPSPSATAQTLPDAGVSLPTYFGIALGILAILLPLLLIL